MKITKDEVTLSFSDLLSILSIVSHNPAFESVYNVDELVVQMNYMPETTVTFKRSELEKK